MAVATPQRLPSSASSADLAALMLDNVTLKFGDDVGIYDLSLRVPPGTIFGLIGPSGSGKTTTVRLMTGVYTPQQGSVQVFGVPAARMPGHLRAKIGYMPQSFTLYPNLTVLENLNFVASLYGMSYFTRRKRLREILDFVRLADARHRLGSQLSGGMQRRLSLACALAHNPTLLFADEPTAGIDPVLREHFWASFRNLRDQGRTLVITTQYVGEAAYCDRVGVMRDGRLIHLDTPDGLRRTALGGQIITLTVAPHDVGLAIERLLQHPEVSDIRRSRSQAGTLDIAVRDAAAALPQLLAILGSAPAITVQSAAEYQPPFDDIFVALMDSARQSDA